MAIYSAINIGPIFKTLNMARKPRELWAASFLFSYLMQHILKELEKLDGIHIISPARKSENIKHIGLYPDRTYFICDTDELSNTVKSQVEEWVKSVNKELNIKDGYFNVMYASVVKNSQGAAIMSLNKKLDILELYDKAKDSEIEESIFKLISSNKSAIFEKGWEKGAHIPDLENIALGNFDDNMTYSKYYCIVQADGDNMGKAISGSSDDNVHNISTALLNYAEEAINLINKYCDKALPLYAGGDDLLFIAPVRGQVDRKDDSIFSLIAQIDSVFQDKMKDYAPETSLSYGIAIVYYKYPLYEALKSARNLLFDNAKNIINKNAVAWELRKHSGGAFAAGFSKRNGNESINHCFNNLIDTSDVSESIVSAVAHKIRSNEALLNLWFDIDGYKGRDKEQYKKQFKERNENFYHKFMEQKELENFKNSNNDGYKENDYKLKTRQLLNALYDYKIEVDDYNNDKAEKDRISYSIEDVVKQMYGMLRTAKFLKGEKKHDE